MGVIGIGVGTATLGRICRDKDGNITEQSTARWDAAAYLCRVVELIHPNRQINIPNLEAMIRAAAKDGVDICTYCPDYNCRGCIVNEWKEDPDDE